jgi:hypothetical protein
MRHVHHTGARLNRSANDDATTRGREVVVLAVQDGIANEGHGHLEARLEQRTRAVGDTRAVERPETAIGSLVVGDEVEMAHRDANTVCLENASHLSDDRCTCRFNTVVVQQGANVVGVDPVEIDPTKAEIPDALQIDAFSSDRSFRFAGL